MARPESPEGRRVPVSFKLSEAEAALVDSVRGALERGPWMRQAALEAAKGNTGIPEPATAGAPAGSAPRRKRDPKACKHENMRLHRGWCPDCESMAVKK